MKNSLAAGAIAGLPLGIGQFFFMIVGVILGVLPPDGVNLLQLFTGVIITGIIWGAMFGVLYPLLYDKIPGKGILKGLVYGLIILAITHGMFAFYLALALNLPGEFIIWIWLGFFAWIFYGPVLGALYKK